MLKLIAGLKGSGKTKTLIELANNRVENTKGTVVVIEKGTSLIHEIKYQARLIDTEDYAITGGTELYGFIAGTYASNHDVTDIFVDSALKICGGNMDDFADFIKKAMALANKNGVNMLVTASVNEDELPEELRRYF